MSVQNGDVVILQIGGVQVGALVSNSKNLSSDMLDKSNKDTPGIKQYNGGETGWGMSVESLYDPAAAEGVSEALGYLKAGTLLTVLHGVIGTQTFNGSAYIDNIDLSGPKNEISSYTLEIQGTGAIDNYGPELHTAANAVSDPNGNEADTTTGWDQTGLDAGANVFESQGAVKNTGSYAFHANCNDTPTSGAGFQEVITVDDGADYRVTFNMRHVGSGDDWNVTAEGSTLATITNTETTFAAYDVQFTATGATATLLFKEANASNNGGIYLDNVSIKKIL